MSSSSPSVEIKCTYEHQNWGVLSIGVIYECECKESIKVYERDTIVSNVTGIHVRHSNNSHVRGIHIIGASYLPKGIETFFPNLIGLSLEQHLKEITQNDLKPFPKLEHFWVARNRLEVIGADLFKYNPSLKYISLKHNFIKHIDPNVFDHLQQLRILQLERNECIDDNAIGVYAVERLITQMKENCVPGRILPMTETEKLIDEKRILNGKVVFWRNFTAVLLSFVVFVIVVAVVIVIKKDGVIGGFKFVSFKNQNV